MFPEYNNIWQKIFDKLTNEGAAALCKDTYRELSKICHMIIHCDCKPLFYNFKWSRRSVVKPNVVYRMAPDEILWKRTLDDSQFSPGIHAGEWDNQRIKFEDDTFYRSAVAFFEEGVSWDETDKYKKKFQNGRSNKELAEYFEYYEKIYADMRDNGYDKRYPVKVAIGRDGDYILWGGKHRLSLAKLVGIEQIPVKVVIRHEQWQNIRHDYVKSKKGSDTNTIVSKHQDHPDIKNTIE